MGNSNCGLEICVNRTDRHQDKDAVLESLGIGPIKDLKRQQLLEDELTGKQTLKQRTQQIKNSKKYTLEERLSTIGEEDATSNHNDGPIQNTDSSIVLISNEGNISKLPVAHFFQIES